jgi:hypothetical protein
VNMCFYKSIVWQKVIMPWLYPAFHVMILFEIRSWEGVSCGTIIYPAFWDSISTPKSPPQWWYRLVIAYLPICAWSMFPTPGSLVHVYLVYALLISIYYHRYGICWYSRTHIQLHYEVWHGHQTGLVPQCHPIWWHYNVSWLVKIIQ